MLLIPVTSVLIEAAFIIMRIRIQVSGSSEPPFGSPDLDPEDKTLNKKNILNYSKILYRYRLYGAENFDKLKSNYYTA